MWLCAWRGVCACLCVYVWSAARVCVWPVGPVDSLEEAVGVNVLVTTGGHTIGVPGLSLGGGAPGVTEGELAELVLGVELCGGGGGGDGELGPGDTDTGG